MTLRYSFAFFTAWVCSAVPALPAPLLPVPDFSSTRVAEQPASRSVSSSSSDILVIILIFSFPFSSLKIDRQYIQIISHQQHAHDDDQNATGDLNLWQMAMHVLQLAQHSGAHERQQDKRQ